MRTSEFVRQAKAACSAAGLPDPWQRFKVNQCTAIFRGIEWRLTFAQWWDLWREFYAQRGNQKGNMVLCRYLDQGCYEVGNVRVDFVEANAHDRVLARSAKGKNLVRRKLGEVFTVARPNSVWGMNPRKLLELSQEDIDLDDMFR